MRKFLAYNISGTYFDYAIIDDSGKILMKTELPFEKTLNRDVIIDSIVRIANELKQTENIEGIAIGTSGQVDSQVGKVMYASPYIHDYTGTELKTIVEKQVNLPVSVENNVNCIALAESWKGEAVNKESVFFISVGNGLGGSFVQGNQLHAGHTFSAGEIGYVSYDGKMLSDYVTEVNEEIKDILHSPEKDASKNQKVFHEKINELAFYISEAIANVSYIVNPEVILVGGKIYKYKEVLLPMLQTHLQTMLTPNLYHNTDIEIIKEQSDMKLIGAVHHFLMSEMKQQSKKVTTIIDENYSNLTKSESGLADYIMSNVQDIANLTISELSKKAGVSIATITRFCQKVGFGSYNQLRILAAEVNAQSTLLEKSSKNTETKETRLELVELFNRFEEQFEEPLVKSLKQIIQGKTHFILVGKPAELHYLESFALSLRSEGILGSVFSIGDTTIQQFLGRDVAVFIFADTGFEQDVLDYVMTIDDDCQSLITLSSQLNPPLKELGTLHLTLPVSDQISHLVLYGYFYELLKKYLQV